MPRPSNSATPNGNDQAKMALNAHPAVQQQRNAPAAGAAASVVGFTVASLLIVEFWAVRDTQAKGLGWLSGGEG
jgi:hypothetical protein